MKMFTRIASLLALWLAIFAVPWAMSQTEAPLADPGAAPAPEAIEAPAAAEPAAVEPPAEVTEAPAEADAVVAEATETVAAEEIPAEAEPAPVLEVPTEKADVEGVEVTAAEEGSDKISVTLDNVPLQDVVRMFTRISGANIVAGTNLTGNVTVNLQDVEWEPALRVILDSVGLGLVERSPGIYTILARTDLDSEPVISETVFLNYTTVSNVLPVVDKLLVSTNASAVGFPGSNAIIVKETASRMKTIKDVIERIDRPREQVLIEAKFVELNDEAIKNLGINWQVLEGYTVGIQSPQVAYSSTKTRNTTTEDERIRRRIEQDADVNYGVRESGGSSSSSSGNSSSSGGSSGFTTDGGGTEFTESGSSTFSGNSSSTRGSSQNSFDGAVGLSGSGFSDFDATQNKFTLVPPVNDTLTETVVDSVERVKAMTAILSADQFALTLSALKQDTGVTVVSDPKVVVANGETATIHVGEQRPNIRALPQGTETITYSYELDQARPFIDLGVKVAVTPTINNETNFSVRIVPELTREIGQVEPTLGQTFPILSTTRVVTDFSLESGKTVAIGGLTRTGDSETVTKIPVLGDIPIIGTYLFRHTSRQKRQSEVIIFVTMNLARPSTLVQTSGIPEESELIHRHLARKAEKALKAEQQKSKEAKKKVRPATVK